MEESFEQAAKDGKLEELEELEERVYETAREGKLEKLEEILRNNPTLNVNWRCPYGWTALRIAGGSGQEAIVSILLTRSDIDVNLKSAYGETPFLIACERGYTSCSAAAEGFQGQSE